MPWRQGMKVCSWFTTEYVLAVLCILNSLGSIQCGHCPSGWQEGPLEDHCFTVMINTSTWLESEEACKAYGGHLAALTSIEELQFVDGLCNEDTAALLGGAGGGCWAGGLQQQSSSLYPNWTDCKVKWNVSAFPRAPSPVANCSDPSCPDYLLDGWCTLVVNRSLVWENCANTHPFICGLIQGGSCGDRASHKEYLIIIIVVSSVIVTTALGVTIWLLAYRTTKRRRRRRRRLESMASPAATPWRVFSYVELEAFTDGFAEANKLGDGEDVNTYKGILPDGQQVVVKKVRRPGFQDETDFLGEMYKIGRLKHPNLVAMKGCCFDRGDSYIIYEYIPNGSLEKWLHLLPAGARPLDWDTRMRIATGVAHILSFLHDKMKPNLVHRNLRASTVLLDDDFNPHLIGVGLVNMAMSRDTTTASELTVIIGTHGYSAPEFVYRNELTTKSDVFSFGVLLLELITGRTPTRSQNLEESFSDAPTIFEWATPLVQAEAWTDLLDATIGTVPNHSQVKKVCDLVYTCTQHVPSMRPRMSYVLYQLQELQTAELTVHPVVADSSRTTTPARTPFRTPARTPGRTPGRTPDRSLMMMERTPGRISTESTTPFALNMEHHVDDDDDDSDLEIREVRW
ncbi:unnamed protein product [Calypogeia fissa]